MTGALEPNMRSYESVVEGFEWDVPETYNAAVDVCDRHVSVDTRDRLAMFYEDADGARGKYTFREVMRASNRVANALVELGVERGDRVAILLDRGMESAAAHLGAYKLGAVAVALSATFGREGLRYRLDDSGASVLFTQARHRETVEAIRDGVPSLETLVVADGDPWGEAHGWGTVADADPAFDPVDTAPDDPMQIFYTSGTTGMPKGVVHGHRRVLGASDWPYYHDFHAGELYYNTADWAWITSLNAWLGPWKHGVPILVYDGRFDPETVYELLETYEVTNFYTVPTGFRMLRGFESEPLRRYDVDLRVACTGGEPLGAEMLEWGREALGVKINELYGQTEVFATANYPAVETKPGSAGRPLPGHEVAVLDDDGEELPPGELGQVAVGRDTPAYFLEYWNRPEATAAVRTDGWHLTGDAGQLDEDGYLWIEGRIDDVIVSSGYRIGPYEVESTVEKHGAVTECAVVGVPDETRGEVVKAYVTLNDGYEPDADLRAAIQEFVKAELAAYEYPRELEFVDGFERTVSGKIKRAELKPGD